MSAPPPRQNNTVYIPPRRNIPARLPRGGSSTGVLSGSTVTTGPPTPVDVNRSATVGATPPIVQIAPRTTSGATVSIPSRGASAQGFPDRGTAFAAPGQRMSFVPPPRRNLPSQAAPPYPPRPSVQVPLPHSTIPYTEQQYQHPPYPQQSAYPPPQAQSSYLSSPQSFDSPYAQPTAMFPEPQFRSFNTGNEYGRRPVSFHADAEVQIPLRRDTQRYSFSETSSISSLDEEASRLSRQASDGSVYAPAPIIPPRSTGFMIPMRNTSVQRPNIDTLLDEGGMAYAAPRYNIEEALSKWRQARELAVKEKDLLREAKALSNIGCALRNQGKLQDSLNELRDAWDVSTKYVEDAAWRSNSLWLQLVMRHADIDSDIEPDETGGSVRTSSTKSLNDPAQDASQGPPIVVWFLQLTTNLGNGYFCLGQYQEAIQYHDMCRRLAEAVLEEYPLPPGFNLPNLQRTSSAPSLSTGGSSETMPGNDRRSSFDAGPSTKTKIKLSYLHRQTLLAQSRSLTHLGLCHQQLGLDDEALNSHTQAESIVTFYSARLLASTSTRRASLSNPQAIPTEVYAAEAAIVANVGTSYYAKGRLPLALEYHDRAAKLFRNIQDTMGRAKEEANLGCLHIEVGRTLNSMQWIRSMETSGNGALDLAECRRYWGPPRLETINIGTGSPDETAPEVIGQPLFDQGILALYEVAKVFKSPNDWIGSMLIYANLAVGYVLLHQPYLALYYLSRVVRDPSPDTSTSPTVPPNTFAPGPPGTYKRGGVPPQENPDRPLFPPATVGKPIDQGTGIPVMDPEPVNKLLRALDMPVVDIKTLNDESLTELLEGCRQMLDSIMNLRAQAAATLYAMGSASLDVTRQKSVITSATTGKVAWVLASAGEGVPDDFRTLYLDEGRGALARSVMELAQAVKTCEAGSASSGLVSPASNGLFGDTCAVRTEGGVLGTMLDLANYDEAITDEAGLNPLTWVGPSLLGLSADLIAYAFHQHLQRLSAGRDLLELLGLPAGKDANTVRRTLLSSARKVYGSQVGLCESCGVNMVSDLVTAAAAAAAAEEAGGGDEVEPVLVSFKGRRTRRDEGGKELVFPCEHYKWKAPVA
ncbi:hypothetical protein SpCBS45565_g07783 [Spizellomyces sp. 'palustris']|nr:hypothetical protein SpCBS45565_g07783 [Spizellomyces sp. 'palustris']